MAQVAFNGPFVHDSAERWLALNMRRPLHAPKAKPAAAPGRCAAHVEAVVQEEAYGVVTITTWEYDHRCHPSLCVQNHGRRVNPARSRTRTHRRACCRRIHSVATYIRRFRFPCREVERTGTSGGGRDGLWLGPRDKNSGKGTKGVSLTGRFVCGRHGTRHLGFAENGIYDVRDGLAVSIKRSWTNRTKTAKN
jgi:hypothetical protein